MEKTLTFKKVSGHVIENVEQYVKSWTQEHPYGRIIIGCDSQVHGRRVKYSVAVVMHDVDRMGVGHGAHVLVADLWEKRMAKSPLEEMPAKLWKEAELTLIAAQMVDGNDEIFKKRMILHLDYSNDAANKSNIMFAAGLGYLTGMGYHAEGKPASWCATHTADHFCR